MVVLWLSTNRMSKLTRDVSEEGEKEKNIISKYGISEKDQTLERIKFIRYVVYSASCVCMF